MSKKAVIQRALISVSDKSGLIPFAKGLSKQGVEILSTGGTLRALSAAGVPAMPVEDFTGFPEILEGRVKTLHPKIHGGLLFRRNQKAHVSEATQHGIAPIDMVVVNLYPFEEVTSKPAVTSEEAIENIDIGGPSMLRSAAKNCESVTVICDPADYAGVLKEMTETKGTVSDQTRRHLAEKVFARTASYDKCINDFLTGKNGKSKGSALKDSLPAKLDVVYTKETDLRYGENPHQRAALYTAQQREPRFQYKQLHGKELSYNNLLDIEATIDILREFTPSESASENKPAACVVKHNNPCGVAESGDLPDALERAIECDMMSAFGGIVGINKPCDKKTATVALDRLRFFEVFIAPSFAPAALKALKARKNLRIIETGSLGAGGPYDMRFTKGGILLQDRDRAIISDLKDLKKNLKFVTKVKLKSTEIDDLLLLGNA